MGMMVCLLIAAMLGKRSCLYNSMCKMMSKELTVWLAMRGRFKGGGL